MATKKQTQDLMERALARAAKESIRVVADFGDHWQVRGSDGVTLYTVQATDEGLRCTCSSRLYCKHQAVCQQRLNQQLAEREQFAAEAGKALVLADRGERTLAGQTYSQEERLRALAVLACGDSSVCRGPGTSCIILLHRGSSA